MYAAFGLFDQRDLYAMIIKGVARNYLTRDSFQTSSPPIMNFLDSLPPSNTSSLSLNEFNAVISYSLVRFSTHWLCIISSYCLYIKEELAPRHNWGKLESFQSRNLEMQISSCQDRNGLQDGKSRLIDSFVQHLTFPHSTLNLLMTGLMAYERWKIC